MSRRRAYSEQTLAIMQRYFAAFDAAKANRLFTSVSCEFLSDFVALRRDNNITKVVQNGRLHIERFPQGVDKTYRGVLGQAEACLERGDGETDSSALEKGFRNGGAAERARQQERVGERQEAQLEAWAKDNGLWLNDDYEDGTLETYLSQTYEDIHAFGSESTLYKIPGNENVIVKATNLSHYNCNPRMMLDKYVMFNALFPGTAYDIIGFGRDAMGQFTVVTEQPFIQEPDNAIPSQEDIDAFMKSLGLIKKGRLVV